MWAIAFEYTHCHLQTEIQAEQELNFQLVHLWGCDTTHFCIVCIVVVSALQAAEDHHHVSCWRHKPFPMQQQMIFMKPTSSSSSSSVGRTRRRRCSRVSGRRRGRWWWCVAMQAILGFREEEEEVVVVVAMQAVLGFREEEDIVLTHRQGTWRPPWRWWSTSDGHSRRWWGSQVAGEWNDPCTRKPPRSRRDCSWRTWRCAPGTSRCWLWELGSRGTPSSSEDKCCGSMPESESRSLPPLCPTETTERRWLEAAFLLLHMMMMISCCRCRQGHQHLLLREALGRRTGLMSQMMMLLL